MSSARADVDESTVEDVDWSTTTPVSNSNLALWQSPLTRRLTRLLTAVARLQDCKCRCRRLPSADDGWVSVSDCRRGVRLSEVVFCRASCDRKTVADCREPSGLYALPTRSGKSSQSRFRFTYFLNFIFKIDL
ncbi:hypothetical protein Adt_45378 [Abeliophyllum distichum]|uniref:Uncharacterized protein n=1 Tax=Abeliophyllum distichum TaxID=126358 RepID=A0ABD1PDH9_9LAMI